MYIVAIAWLYVVILMSVMQSSWLSAAGTLVGYGLAPLALLLWIVGTPQRRRTRRAREAKAAAAATALTVSDKTHAPDHQHAEHDQ